MRSDKASAAKAAGVVRAGPRPRGAYPHFRRAGPLVFVSGTSARQADNTIKGASSDELGTATLDIRAQTAACIENMRTILEEAGGGLENLVEVSVFLVSMNDFGGYNEVYAKYFSEDGPARTTVAVHQLPHPHLLIEIRGTAYIVEQHALSGD
ncbi:MAG: RidA family protein [Devosia sp.]